MGQHDQHVVITDGNLGGSMLGSDNESYDQPDTGTFMTSEADVTCPCCGEVVSIALDPGGGAEQEYIQDCDVCCRPWQVQVSYGRGGVQVWVTAS